MRLGFLLALVAAIASLAPTIAGAKPPGKLTEARLAGRYEVILRVNSASNFDARVGGRSEEEWAFAPACRRGACSAKAVFTPFGLLTIRVPLQRRGAVYAGGGKGALAFCAGQPVSGDIRIELRVRKGEWIRGTWRVASWAGTLRLSVPARTVGYTRCRAGSFSAGIWGSWLV